MTMIYPFTQDDSFHAYETWGANCGPNALAFALQVPLDTVRPHIPDFDAKRYTSPSMMRAALASLGREFDAIPKPAIGAMLQERPALVRIQWGGPWIINGKPQRWAARQTHWICCWWDVLSWVFDVNGGIQTFVDWEDKIVPPLAASVPRCDGTWTPANVWRLR